MTGTAAPDPVLAGGTLTYTLTVANQGVADADGVILNDQLPAGVSLVSVNTSQGFRVPQMGEGSVTVALGTIPAGSSATVTIQVQTAAGTTGTIVDKATISSQETGANSGASVTISDTVETNADVAVTLAEGPSNALAGRPRLGQKAIQLISGSK